MNLDLHRVLARKQERECAKLDDFAFKARARTMGLFAEWLRSRGHDVDPRSLATQIATATDDAILDHLIQQFDGDRHSWLRAFRRARANAERELAAEIGDPTPRRLA